MKKEYTSPEVEITDLYTSNVFTESGLGGDDDDNKGNVVLPFDPF